MNAPHPPPAGWYPDPAGRAPFRYWDGTRWTEHTQQGTAPSPAPVSGGSPPAPPAPAMTTPPTYAPGPQAGAPYQPAPYAAGPYGAAAPLHPAAPRQPGGPLTPQSFLEDLKRLEGLAVVIAGAVLLIIASFLPWNSSSIVNQAGQKIEDSSNGWSSDGVWLIRGLDVTVANVQKAQQGDTSGGGTDMVIILPLALVAAGVAVALKLGKPVNRGIEIVLGASAATALLLVAEAIHVSGALSDLDNMVGTSSGLSFGIFVGIAAALAMALGAVRSFQATRTVPGQRPPS